MDGSTDADGYPIGEVARLTGVTVRTLHHYDELGLLRPSTRTAAGHRRYSAGDLTRLRTVLFYRELDFALDEIAQMLADPGRGTDDHLRRQHQLLRERRHRDAELLRALEKQMEARRMGLALTPEEEFEVFGNTDHSDTYAAEAGQRWGDTDQWRESRRRTAAYTKQDWVTIKAEADAIERDFAAELGSGRPADGAGATTIAERHRQHITDWFYEVSPDFHRGLAEMFVADDRFRAHYDDIAPGLAQYVHDAVIANAG